MKPNIWNAPCEFPMSLNPTFAVYASACEVPASSHDRNSARVGLTGAEVAADHVAFGLDHEDRHIEVVADLERRRDRDVRQRWLRESCSSRAPAVDHEAVVDLRGGMHRVEVRDEPARRLRLAGRDQPIGLKPAEDGRDVLANVSSRDAEHVVGVTVARVHQ